MGKIIKNYGLFVSMGILVILYILTLVYLVFDVLAIESKGDMRKEQKLMKIEIFNAEKETYEVVEKVSKAEAQWKELLEPEVFRITREKGTERAFTGKLLKNKESGIYTCSNCGNHLFRFETKFDSGTGWPSFYNPVDTKNVELKEDNSFFAKRIEVVCSRCGAHLGHVFNDGPPPTGKRYCINSLSLGFVPLKR